ncbi:hypothetical protein AAG906_034026 [Vitis piasezkii]
MKRQEGRVITQKMHRPSLHKVEEETIIEDKKVMTSLREDEKNTIASISNSDEVLVLSNEYTAVFYHATPHLELFSDYKVGDFGTVKMGNSSHSKIVGMGYENQFGKGKWKLTKGSLVVAKGEVCCTLYKTQWKVCNDELHAIKCNSSELWHKRLGHMSEKGLQVLARNRSKKKLEKLELVYFDVCGPMDVETLGGNRVRCMLKIAKLPKVF